MGKNIALGMVVLGLLVFALAIATFFLMAAIGVATGDFFLDHHRALHGINQIAGAGMLFSVPICILGGFGCVITGALSESSDVGR